MANYRYYVCDLLTNNYLADLQLYGVNFGKQVNAAGQFTGSFRLGTGSTLESVMMQTALPSRTALMVERNGTIIWGGPLWTRTYESDGQSMQLQAATFESVFDSTAAQNNIIQQGIEQVALFKNIVDAMQAQAGSNYGFFFANQPNTAINRTVLIPGYEFHYFQEAIDQLLQGDDTFEYTIEVVPSAITDEPLRQIRIGYPTLNATATDLVFDFPGNLTKYWWPETSTNAGTVFAGIGYGTGNTAPTAIVRNGTKLDAGYPALWRVNTYSTVIDPQLLASKVKKDADTHTAPLARPTFAMNPDKSGAEFTGWNELGAPCTVNLQDFRFPTGKIATSRMLGWSLSVNEDAVNELQFTIEGSDAL